MIYEALQEAKTLLGAVEGVASLKIGLERGLGAKDAPFIRLLPEKFSADGHRATLTLQVVFGFDVKNRDHEELYRKYFETEAAIRDALEGKMRSGNCLWIETVTDEDQVPNLKAGVALFTVSAIPLRTELW